MIMMATATAVHERIHAFALSLSDADLPSDTRVRPGSKPGLSLNQGIPGLLNYARPGR